MSLSLSNDFGKPVVGKFPWMSTFKFLLQASLRYWSRCTYPILILKAIPWAVRYHVTWMIITSCSFLKLTLNLSFRFVLNYLTESSMYLGVFSNTPNDTVNKSKERISQRSGPNLIECNGEKLSDFSELKSDLIYFTKVAGWSRFSNDYWS